MANQRAQTPLPVAGGRGQPGVNPNQPRQRILRIGVLLGGNLVEERLIRDRVAVVIGQSTKKTNTFSIPIEGLPLEFTLFAIDENKYYLRFINKMDGRVSDGGGQVNTLDALKQRGSTQVGDYYQVPIGDGARGKLSLGDLTILFQFVTEPPRQPKPMLPASVRGTFADRFDPRLTVIMAICIIFNFSFVTYFYLQDLEEPDSLAQKANNLSFKQDTVELEDKKPDPEPVKETGSDGSAAAKPDKATAKPDTSKPTPKPTPTDGGGRKDTDNVALKEAEEARAAADALTAFGPNGKSEGDMSSRRPGADLNQQIADVKDSGKTVKVGGGTGGGSRNSGDPRVGTGNGPKLNGPNGTETAGGPKGEKEPTGRISVSSKPSTDDESSLTPDAVLKRIQSYMPGITHCYKEYLKKEATARGKVQLTFTVNPSGRVVSPSASGFPGAEVNSCIQSLMGGWTFPIPKADGQPTSATFSIGLQLVPE
jgi:hypothetical protein